MHSPLKTLRRWIWNVLYATDVWINALTGGDPQHTISLRAARAASQGELAGVITCDILDKFKPGHCLSVLEADLAESKVN